MKPTNDKIMEAIYLQSSLQFGETLKSVSDSDYRRLRDNYDALLKQPLKLRFFVPCDENGNVLDPSDVFKSCEKGFLYGKAKERVLFKYFKVVEYSDNTIEIVSDTAPNFIIPFKKLSNKDWEQRYNHIEDLLKSIIEIQLTETAIKQIGL